MFRDTHLVCCPTFVRSETSSVPQAEANLTGLASREVESTMRIFWLIATIVAYMVGGDICIHLDIYIEIYYQALRAFRRRLITRYCHSPISNKLGCIAICFATEKMHFVGRKTRCASQDVAFMDLSHATRIPLNLITRYND